MQVEAVTLNVMSNIEEVKGLSCNSPLQSTTAMLQRLMLMPLAKLKVLWRHPKLLERGREGHKYTGLRTNSHYRWWS